MILAAYPMLEVPHEEGRWLLLGAGDLIGGQNDVAGRGGLRCISFFFQSVCCKSLGMYCAKILI